MSNHAVTVNGIAALRQAPKGESELADEALFGMEVKILDKAEEWLLVETFYGYRGYAAPKDILTTPHRLWLNLEKQYVIAPFTDIQAEPKYSSYCKLTLPRGAALALTGDHSERWLEVLLPDGEKGWVREESLLLRDAQKAGRELRQAIVQTAMLYLYTQYRWGGKTPAGIDCSGLSFMAYLLNGITLPRDSKDQMNFMKKVARKETKPGDLLFFPGHVAIYIGEDKFIHATGTEAVVKINSLNKDSRMYREDLDKKYICSGTVF